VAVGAAVQAPHAGDGERRNRPLTAWAGLDGGPVDRSAASLAGGHQVCSWCPGPGALVPPPGRFMICPADAGCARPDVIGRGACPACAGTAIASTVATMSAHRARAVRPSPAALAAAACRYRR